MTITLTPVARVPPPLKWHGGKHYLAPKIVALMPSHLHYVEPYAGGLSVLLAKAPDGVSEVVNDIDGRLTNFWRILQGDDTFDRFRRVLEAVPFSEAEWRAADPDEGDPVERAVHFFIHCRQSLAGRMTDFASLSRARTRRGMNEQASAWLAEVELAALSKQCLDRRIESLADLRREVEAWEEDRNRRTIGVQWQFTTADARIKLHRLYPSIQSR